MGRPHSEETKRKISEAAKQVWAERRIQKSPTALRMRSVGEHFAEAHPDGVTPRVRNYGGLGRDVAVVLPEKKADASLQKREETHPDRLAEFKARTEGSPGGQVQSSMTAGAMED